MKQKVYFYVLLTAAVKYFKEFYKQDQEQFIKDEEERIAEHDNPKLMKAARDNFKKGLATLKGMHHRFIDAAEFILKRYIPKHNIEGRDNMEEMSTYVCAVLENTMKKEDCPKILHLVKLYNSGAFDDFFNKIENPEQPSQEKEVENAGS